MLTFINEITQLSDTIPDNIQSYDNNMIPYSNKDPKNIILTNIQGKSDFMSQIIEVRKRLKKEGRHPSARNGVYYIFGLVKFAAYK